MVKKKDAIVLLRKWTLHYIKNRDILTKKIEQITEIAEDKILVKLRDKNQLYIIRPFLADDSLISIIGNALDENCFCYIVMFNSLKNLNKVFISWDKLIKFPKLALVFVNPFAKQDMKWVLVPYTHNLISDKKSLKHGLKTMFETVEPISEREIMAKMEP